MEPIKRLYLAVFRTKNATTGTFDHRNVYIVAEAASSASYIAEKNMRSGESLKIVRLLDEDLLLP